MKNIFTFRLHTLYIYVTICLVFGCGFSNKSLNKIPVKDFKLDYDQFKLKYEIEDSIYWGGIFLLNEGELLEDSMLSLAELEFIYSNKKNNNSRYLQKVNSIPNSVFTNIDNRKKLNLRNQDYFQFEIEFKNHSNDTIKIDEYKIGVIDPIGNQLYQLIYTPRQFLNSTMVLLPKSKQIIESRFKLNKLEEVLKINGLEYPRIGEGSFLEFIDIQVRTLYLNGKKLG